MKDRSELNMQQLRFTCNESQFDFESTAQLPALEDIIGQNRAVEAIEFGMNIESDGFNIFALGPAGAGRTTAIQRFVQEKAKERPVPDDWCYIYNFSEPHKPIFLRLPAGRGRELRADVEQLLLEVKREIQLAFEREDYESERNRIMEQFQNEQNALFSALQQKGEKDNFAIQRGPTGIVVIPMHGDHPITKEEYDSLSEKGKMELDEKGQELNQELNRTIHAVRELGKKARDKLQELERKTVLFAVEYHIELLKKKYSESADISNYLENIQEDIVANARSIIGSDQTSSEQPPLMDFGTRQSQYAMDRYMVNLIVDNSQTKGAPVIVEGNPIFQNLIGRIERKAQFGMLITDFNMIKPGALHRANGGYLILEADHLLRNPFAYDALKHAVKEKEIKITDISEMYSLISAAALEPVPIPLDVKVILIGNPMIYYMLYNMDEEFSELFKVKADFGAFMERNEENIKLYAQFLAARCKDEGWIHFDKSGIARVVEYGSELTGDQTRLSTRFSDICDIAREAHYWALKQKNRYITRKNVQDAIDARIRRANRIEETMQEMIEKGDIFINTEGEVVGQVNGLSVISLGDYTFGKPSRITARTYIGRGGVINIDREARMSGPIHNKGVLILAGYLNGKYGKEKPVSLSASIVFEQLYEGVEGDSASSTELYAILSSLSGFPIKQGFAVTGSVNQRGEIQPIGGVTQKIEGFFDVCKAKGLTGEQGVLIPETNVKNLMLRDEVVQAVKDGKFHIYPVETIDQGIELLTGVEAGALLPDGSYPDGTVNNAVDTQMRAFAECWKDYHLREEKKEKAVEGEDH